MTIEDGKTEKGTIQEFAYRPNRLLAVAIFPLACGGYAILAWLALFGTEGLHFFGVDLTPGQTRVFYGIFALLSPIGMIALGMNLIVSLREPRRVALTEEALIVPKLDWTHLSRDELEIPLSQIASTTVVPFVGKELMLQIIHAEGSIPLFSNMFRSRQEFEKLCIALTVALERRDARYRPFVP